MLLLLVIRLIFKNFFSVGSTLDLLLLLSIWRSRNFEKDVLMELLSVFLSILICASVQFVAFVCFES